MSDETIPLGWALANLPAFTHIEMGQSPPSSTYNIDGVGMPFFQGKTEFGKFHPEIRKYCSEPSKVAEEGATLLSVRAPVGPTNLANVRCCIGRGLAAIHPLGNIPPYFVLYLLRSLEPELSKQGTGSTFAAINRQFIEEISIPLPPLPEQKRIVAKIEELFSELEAGESSLRKARRQLGVYRQSLLKQAFEGKLTQKWRTQNPDTVVSAAASDVSPEELKGFADLPRGWRYTRFGRSIRHIDAGKSFRCEERRPSIEEIGVAKVSAVTWGEYDEAESKTCMDPEKVNSDYLIHPGDFILSRANTIELVGACVIVRRVTQRIMLSDKTLRITMDDALKPFFLHYLRSRQGRLEIEKRSTGNQESMRNIGQERIRSIVVPECSLPEQHEIVRILDEQFEAIERNERELDAALKRSEALRQSILKRAFSGRLVPQDPSDEPASALLAHLRAERSDSAVPKRRGRQTQTA